MPIGLFIGDNERLCLAFSTLFFHTHYSPVCINTFTYMCQHIYLYVSRNLPLCVSNIYLYVSTHLTTAFVLTSIVLSCNFNMKNNFFL